jgi:hypothetical protein
VGKGHLVPFWPESRMRELGGLYEKVSPCNLPGCEQATAELALIVTQ